MNVLRRPLSWLAVAGVCLAGAVGVARGQLVLGDLQERALPFGDGVVVRPDDAENDAIGDPWWDDAAPPPPVAASAAAPDDAETDDIDPQAEMQAQLQAQAEMLRQGLEQQGLAILRRELSVVRQTCPSLGLRQRAIVLEAGRQAIEQLVDQHMVAVIGRRRGARADIEEAINAAVRTAVAANAAAVESAAYAAERGLRQERFRQATIATLVADVDRDAFLDEPEREALAKALSGSYRDRWRQVATSLGQGPDGMPGALPAGLERCVEKALGKERQAEWLARRVEARELLAQAEGGEDGVVVIQEQGVGRAVRRVIRRQAIGNGVEMRLEVRIGGAVEAAPEAGDDGEAEK